MEKCILCGSNTTDVAPFYAGIPTPQADGRRRMVYTRHSCPCCPDCVRKAHRKGGGLASYGAMQLLWFTVARHGLSAPIGLAASAAAGLALLRLILLLLRRYWPEATPVPHFIMGKLRYPEEASELVIDTVRQDPAYQGMHLLSQAAYSRCHTEAT